MKLIEKLGEDWAKNRNSGDPLDLAYDSFVAGFLKARAMALDLEDKYSGQFKLRKHLENMGESEAD